MKPYWATYKVFFCLLLNKYHYMRIGTIMFCLMMLFISKSSFSQSAKTDSIKYFIVLYSVGEAWDTTKQFYEQKHFEDHSDFLGNLRKNKKIPIGARYSDKGMIILKAKNESDAIKIMEGDVSVKNKLFRFELNEMDVFYEGCLD